MASGGAEEEDGCVPLDIDNVHMLLQVEHEQIQKRTFTNWINAQLAKKCPPSFMSDLFSDLKDGSRLLDLLEVLSGQHMRRQRGRGVFQQRANIETALNFLKKKNVKLVNINIPDIIDGRPSIILGLVWTIILHCHIEELANALSFSSRHSSLDSLASLDSWSGSPVPSSPVPGGRASPLHRRFRVTAKKALLMWVRDQCQRVGCSISVKDFKASWRSGEAFLAILCALRPELVDLSAARHRSHRENLEEAFLLAEKELHIPRLLEPQDVDVKDPEEKSIMTYVAQFLQYSNDMPAPDEHEQLFPPLQPSCFSPVNLPSHYTPAIAVSPLRQASPSERAREVTCWLQQAKQELSESWEAADTSSYTEKYQVFQSLAGSFSEQRKPVLTLLTSIRRCPELIQEQQALKAAWDHLEEQLQRCKSDLDLSVPPPLDTVVVWLQRAEAVLTEEGDAVRDHADAAKEARSQQEMLKTLCREMSRQVNTLDTFHNMDESGNVIVPSEKFDEIKRRLTNVRVTAKYQGIKLEYRESRHTVLDLLSRVSAKLQVWRAPYVSQEAVRLLLQDWHETVERQGLLLILQDALQSLQRRADAYTSKAALGDDSQLVCRQAKEAAGQAAAAAQAAVAARAAMERAEAAWEMYEGRLGCLQAWLARADTQDVGEWASCHAQLNEAGNLLIEVAEAAVGRALAQQLSGVNMQWAEHMKRSVFEASPGPSAAPLSHHAVGPLVQEAGWLLRQPLQVTSLPLKANRQKMQLLLKKLTEVEALSSVAADKENLQTLTKMLAEGERSCGELQSAASRLEGGLAELQRWSSEALDCQQKLREAEQRGRAALERSARALVSRGIQLQKQVMTDGEDLQNLVDHIQKTSPLLHISAAASQERSSQAVYQSQEVLARFSSLGFQPPAGEIADVQRKEQGGSLVVVKTKHVEQAGSVKLQLIPPAGFPPSHSGLVKPHKVVQVDSVCKADAGGDVPPAGNQTYTAATSPQSPPLSKPTTPSGSPPVQKPKLQLQAATKEPPDASKRSKAPPRPPVMDRGEVLSRAQSMARSRLEKARSRLQGRIQQAIKLFGGRGVSETQARRKQRALKVLQPELLLEFLVAVDGYAAFCSEPQLRELMLLSDSVRKQWEDVRSEMAEFVPILRSHIRLDKQSLSAAEREIQTNRMLHEAAKLPPPPPQQQAATEGAPSAEEGVETLQQLCETLLPGASSCLPTDQLKESDETQETKPRVAALPDGCRGQQLLGGPPPTATGTPTDRQHNNKAAQSQEGSAASGWLGAVKTQTPTQDAAVETGRPLMLSKAPARSCMRDPSKEQALKARVLVVAEANQQVQTHIQTVVRGDTVETKQEAEWTVIPEAAGASSQQDVVERYRTSFTVPQNQLWSEPGSGSARSPLHRESQPEALCFRPELQYTQRSQFPQLVMGEDSEEAETEQVREQWRGRQMMTQTSRASLAGSSDLTEEQMALISEDLDLIFKRPVDISSWTSADPRLISDLKDLDDKLPSDTRKQSEERGGPEFTSSSSVCQLRRRLEPLQSASRSLARFLAAARAARAEISNPLPIRDPSGRREQAEREQERRSWQADVLERAGDADGALKAAGMTLTLDGAAVMCWDLAAALLSQKVADTEREPTGAREERQLFVQQEPGNTCDGEEESGLQAKRSKLEDARALGEEALEWQRRRGRRSHAEEKTSALIGALKELQAAAEQLGLQEPTLPALQQRTRALRRIESQLASRLPELHQLRDADGSQTSEVEEVWEETSKAVVDRLDECGVLTDLLKRFQSTRDMLSCTLQRAESAIGEQASYLGRDYLQRLHTKVQETKAELNGLGAGIEEVRTTCRQLHTHLRKIPQCTANPFEGEADALMDRWLDISERTDSHLDNLHLALTLWDGVLQLGAELESRADNKLSVFAESPSLHSQEDIRALQNEIATQEESVERFHRRAAEIQALLQSAEPPLELQVVETQMRKKVEELRELVSDAEEVSQQMTATKKQISDRMSECCSSLQRIQTSLLSHAEETPEKLKAVCVELQTQQQHAERLLEDVCVLASIASPDSLHTLTADGARLQGEVRATRRLYSELEETSRLQKVSEETAAKAENPSFPEEETHRCRATTETLSLQSCWPRQAAPVRLVERHQSIRTAELDEQTHKALNGMNGVKGDVSTLTLARDLRGRQRLDCDAAEELGVSVCDGSHLKMENKETTQEAADSLAASLRHQTPPFPWPGSAQRERVLQPRDRAELLQPGRAAELQGVCCRPEEGVCDEERAGRRELSPLQEGMSACQSSAGRDAEDAALQVALHSSIMDNLEVLTESSRQSIRTQGEVETLAGKRPGKQEVLLGTKVQLDGGQRDVEVDGEAAGPASPLTFIKSTGSLDNRRPSTESGDSNQQLVATSLYRDESKASPSIPTNANAKDDVGAVRVDPLLFSIREDHMEAAGPAAQADGFKTDAQEAERCYQDISVTPNRVFTVVLDVDLQNHGISGASESLPALPPETSKSQGVNQPEKAAENTSTGGAVGESFDPESKDTPGRCTAMMGNTEHKSPWSLEATEEQQTQIQVDMEAAEVAGGCRAMGVTGGSAEPGPGKRSPTMQDVLSEIQELVEKGDVINRTPHVDLKWYLQSSPGEAEIRLARTVQKVLACRYQPAQLDVTAMAKQLEEAEDYESSVVDQVAQMKETGSAGVCDPSVLKRVEAQWNAALLDASATVQVKAAQLDQVRRYHRQMKMAKAFLEVVALEREKMSLNALGSSALQAGKLQALLNTMAQKKGMWPELLQLSRQFSVHLSNAESSGALLAQLGDVQDEWRVLEGSIKRALRHASNSASQAFGLIKEVKQLKDKVEAVQESLQSSWGTCDTKSTLEFLCLTTDLKLYNQLHLHLKSQSDALIHFSLGQKEKDEVKCSLHELGTLLSATNFRLNSMFSGVSLAKISKHFQDLITWAKQAENHITVGKKLSLFPEEARVQIIEMKKFQTDIFTRRSKIQVEEMKAATSDMVNEDHDQVLKTIEDLYEAITDSLDHVLNTIKKNLQDREKLLSQLANMDAWLAETHAKRDPCIHVENLSKADIGKLENELHIHKLATAEIENQLHLLEAMEKTSKETASGLSPGESRYLVNRLSGLWTELDGMLAHERATTWELEELIHERTSSDEELSTIWESLRKITMDLEQQKFPLTEEALSAIAQYKHMLIEHQCEVQEIQHSKEAKRSSLLCTIGELQDRCKAFSIHALEQDKYLHLRKQMEDSRDIAEEQIQLAADKTLSLGERFRLCQVLLVELPLVKTQCQEAADQLEAIAPELNPSELNSERQRIRSTVETLVSWEHSVLDNIKHLETKLLLGLRFSSELPALTEVFQRARLELQGAEPVSPDEKSIDVALRRCWVIWRNMESGMRVLEALGRRDKINLKNLKELFSLRDASMQECHSRMEGLSQARESLKDYQWAAQGAIGFLHNAETTFLSAPGGFLDCTEEQRQTQQAIEALEDGFQAHICHLGELVPQQPCLSRPKTEQLHISVLSQLLVGRAILEAQAQLRLESLQRCEVRQQSHKSCHEDIRQRLSGFETDLSECAVEHITSYDKCIAQHKRAKVLMEDLQGLARNVEELRAGCPMQSCAAGKDGEVGALWRRWVSLRRGVGLFMAHTEQRGEEWRDITTSMEQCCSLLASLQAEVPDSSTVSFTQEKPQKLLAQAEMHQAGLEQEQQALASLEHRLEHALSLSSSQDPVSPGPVGKTLVKIQENVRSLKERNLLVVAVAEAEERERQQVEEKMEEVERHIFDILPMLETCSDPLKQQEFRSDLFSQRAKLKSIMDGMQSRYAEIPADISRRIQGIQHSLQGAEEKLTERSDSVRKLASRVAELGSGLDKVKALLETRSSDVSGAQNTLKRVWDELDMWHGRLMLLDNEVQDVAEDQPEQAHLFMDQLMQPLQLYQSAAQMAEQRTAFLSKIPACLQEFEDILHSATCWLDEARSWHNAPVSFTTARSLQNHANSLQLVVDDSERIRDALHNFRPVLAEISTVCDISLQESRLEQNHKEVHMMRQNVLEPLELLLHAVVAVEDMEAEIKCMEKNISKIRAILSSMDNSSITLTEHLQNRQVILANLQSMRKTLEEMQSCKAELRLPQRAEDGLVVFNRTGDLLQSLTELEELTQQQAAQLEDQIRHEEESSKDHGVAASPRVETPQQECNSEEEESEEDSSYLSSSSDTLTCSIPEDPDDTLNDSDLQSLGDVTGSESLDLLGSEVKARSKSADELPPVTSELEIKNSGPAVAASKTMDSKLDPQLDTIETLLLKTATSELLAVSTAELVEPLVVVAAPNHLSRDASLTDTLVAAEQTAAAEENTALIPEKPITPITVVCTSAAPGGREHGEVGSTDHGLVDESQRTDESSEVRSSSDDEDGQQRWHRLRTQISQKLSTLVKVQEEQQAALASDSGAANGKVPNAELLSTGSASAVLQQTSESMDLLKSTANSSDGVREGLYVAARRVLLCLDSLTDLLLMPRGSAGDDAQLRLLQHQCLSGELQGLCGLLGNVESESRAALEGEEPDAVLCLTSLQQCLQTAQLILTGAQGQPIQHLELQHTHQELFSDQLCALEEFELRTSEIFPNHKQDAASIEQCMLGRHQSERPGEEELALQKAAHSLLQGIAGVLELSEGWMMEEKMICSSSSSQLQSALCKHKKLSQLLASQLAFAERLFHQEPKALSCQEDERVQLEVRAKAWQQQAFQQEVAAQGRLQEWICWEDSCGRLGRTLDELEGYISGGEPEGEEEEETVVQSRVQACQQTLLQLDQSRAAVGLILDQGSELQAGSAKKTGAALELRWRNARRRTEREIRRCRDIRESRASFQTDSAHVSEWLHDANKRLKTWLDLASDTEPNPECVRRTLIELLEFSSEVEAASARKTSASHAASRLLHLRDADCPGLRAHLAKLEVGWSRLTSDLSATQDALQQRLLAAWPPAELLSDVDGWMKKLEVRLKQEGETLLKAKDAAEVWTSLRHRQELKAGVFSAQLLLDFLSQTGPQVSDVQALRSERTLFAEQLGDLRLRWLHLQGELESQIRRAEQIHHTCADRERRLRRLSSSAERRQKQLNEWKRAGSRTLAHRALLELQAVMGNLKEEAAALQELKAAPLLAGEDEGKEKELPCKVAFSAQAESVAHAFEDLSQQMEALKPALQQAVEEWAHLNGGLRDVSLLTTRVRCALQQPTAPLLSVQQTSGYVDFLQGLQETAGKAEQLWAGVDESYQNLKTSLHPARVETLRDQLEGGRNRWREALQELSEEQRRSRETLSLWQQHQLLSRSCSRRLEELQGQWAELRRGSEVTPQALETLQGAAEDLQSSVGDVLTSSKPLVGRLEPLAASLVQSETRLLSRDVLLLSQDTSARKKSLQEDEAQQRAFDSQLEELEKQTQNVLTQQKAGTTPKDSVAQQLSWVSELFPSLVDTLDASRCLSLSDQQGATLWRLSSLWSTRVIHVCGAYREQLKESRRSLDFEQKCASLTSILEDLEKLESTSRQPQNYSHPQKILSDCQKLQMDVMTGQQLLQGLVCDAVKRLEKRTGEERSALLARVTRLRERWFRSVSVAGQRRVSAKEQLKQWRIYQHGSKLLWKLLRDVGLLLPPAAPARSTLQQLRSHAGDCQSVEDALRRHSPVYTQTLEAGRHLCDAVTEPQSRSRLQSELQAMEETWKSSNSLLEKRGTLLTTALQKWSQCQDGITSITSELDVLKAELKKQLPAGPEQTEEEEKLIQKTGHSLQLVSGGLRELVTMKSDLSQYVAAGDSALLEQQLEQLHGQWEELCSKVSLRRQEIADRLNAWTIFNDKNKEFCDWLTQMENKVCHSGELSIEEMVEKLKKDCMEEINLFSENKSHLKQLGEQLLLASNQAKQTQVRGSLQELNQRWHGLFHHIEARVKKLKETLVTVQQLDKNMSNLRSWLSRIEAELSRPITYSVCHHQEIQRRLAEQQELQRDIEQHTEGVASVLSLCDVLLRDEDAAGGGSEAESDSLQETSRSLDQRWRTICAMALDRRLRIEETWRLWCKFLDDYSRFEDWLKMAERTAANPNSGDVLYTDAKEELKKFEGFQRQVHERLTQLELVNNQYRRLARENRTDRASQLKAMVHEGNRRWDALHRRAAAILRRLKYFTSQREDFESTRESMLVWLTELDLQLTNVEHFSESDVHHKIQQLNSFQKEITLNTERIDGLIVFGEGLIQRSSPQDAALIEDELEELHSYCQEVFSRLVRFHQRLSQPPIVTVEPELSGYTFSLESSLELIGRPWLGRSQGSLPATPSHVLASPMERSGRETPVSVDSLPLEWDHTGDVGGSSHEDEEEEERGEGLDEDGTYFSAISEAESSHEDFVEAAETRPAADIVASHSMDVHESPRWRSPGDGETEAHIEAPPTLTSTPLKQGYLRLMSQCSGSIESIKRVSLILDEDEPAEELGLTGLSASDKQSGVIERWELLQAQSRSDLRADPEEPQTSDLDDITSWLEGVIPQLDRLRQVDPAASVDMASMAAQAKELKEMQKTFTRYKSFMLSVNLRALEPPEQERLAAANRDWSRACTGLQQWDTSLRGRLMRCQEFHETLHSLLLWLAHADSSRYAVDVSRPDTPTAALQQQLATLTTLQEELRARGAQQASLQALWAQLQPDDGAEESAEAHEKIHVTGCKLKLLLREVGQDVSSLQRRLGCESASGVGGASAALQAASDSKKSSSTQRERRDSSPPRSFFSRVLRAAFPLHLLLLLLLLLPCLVLLSESDHSCSEANNFARSFYPMLRYTNGPPPT